MGLNYSYDLIAHRSSAERLVRVLAHHLAPGQGARLLATLTSGVEGVTDRFEREEHGNWGFGAVVDDGSIPRDACLTFLFPADPLVRAYSDEHSEATVEPLDGRFPVGCVWTDVTSGDAFVRVRATAATSSMSVLFALSPSVRATFVAIGRAGGAFLVAFDDEQGDLDAVWPHEGSLSVPAERGGPPDVFSVDGYGTHLLDALGTLGSPPAG